MQYTYYTQPTTAEDIAFIEQVIKDTIKQFYENGKHPFVIPPLKRKQP